MTTMISDNSRPSALSRQLHGLRRRLLAIGAGAGLMFSLPAAAAVIVGWVWLDLLWELSPEVRIAGDVLAALAALSTLAIVYRRAVRSGNRSVMARRLDEVGGTGGQILSGFDLAYGESSAGEQGEQSDALGGGLATLAIDRAGKLATDVSAARAVPVRPLAIAAGYALATIAIIGVAAVAMPRLASTEWLRLTDPLGDHPPYSRVRLTLEPENARVVYGGSLDVFATAAGEPVERVDLVLLDPASGEEEVLPMFPEASDRWRGVLSRVTTPRQYFVRADRARSPRFSLSVITTPRIQDLRCRVAPPAYTHLPAYEGPLPPSGISGLPGTQVQIWATSNRPLRGGTVRIMPTDGKPREVPLAVATVPEEVSGSFAIKAAGKFELQIADSDGTPAEEPASGVIHLLHDDRPFVRIRQPAAVSLATPNAALPVLVAAEDDYGISRVQLYRSLNSSRAIPVDFQLPTVPPTRTDPQDKLPLSSFGLSPGDVIRLFARVEDNDPAGAKGSESPAVEVRIISQQEFERMLRAREGLEVLVSKYRQARRRLESLAKDADGLRKKVKKRGDEKATSSDREKLRQLAERLQEEADQLDAAAKHLLPYDIDQQLSQHLMRLSRKLRRRASDLDQLVSRSGLTAKDIEQGLDDLQRELTGDEQEFDREALAHIDQLELLFPLIEDAAKFVEIVRQQKDLAERLASLKGRDGEDSPLLKGRMRDLELQQKEIRESLARVLDDMEAHAAKLPDRSPFPELREMIRAFIAAVRSSGASEAMSDAEAGLSEFSGTRGHAGAQKAAEILEKFLKKAQEIGKGTGLALISIPGLGELLGNTVAQLLGEEGYGENGNGSGGGMSYRRGTLDNVGLYGQMAGMDPTMSGGQGRDAAAAGGSNGAVDPTQSPADAAAEQALAASGSGGSIVPPGYRIRVGAYFQRIAEERDQGDLEKSR